VSGTREFRDLGGLGGREDGQTNQPFLNANGRRFPRGGCALGVWVSPDYHRRANSWGLQNRGSKRRENRIVQGVVRLRPFGSRRRCLDGFQDSAGGRNALFDG